MQNLLRPRVARSVTTGLVGRAVLCPPDAESTGCFSRTNRLPARSRACKSADGGVPTQEAGSARPTAARSGLRALPTLCAFAPLGRFCARPSWPQCPQGGWSVPRAFFDRDSSGAAKLGGVAVLSAVLFLRAWTPARLVAGFGARPSWPQVFCDRDGRAPSGRLERGQLGRSALKVGGACQRLFSAWRGARRSRARKGADGRIPAEKPGQHDPHRRAVDCAPYLSFH